MAHELSIRENGFAEMAFTGSRDAIWHGLGQSIKPDASLDEWKKEAGMDWEVHESPGSYTRVVGTTTEQLQIPDRKVLFRSDNGAMLGMVGTEFKVVNPGTVIDFFKDLVEQFGFRLSTAGCLFGGKKFWALADTGKSGEVSTGDRIDGHLLLTTAVDGTMSTQGRFTSTRVVCNNTLSIALSGVSARPIVRVTHKRDFDASAVKIDLGVIDKGWVQFMDNMKKLSNTKMGPTQTRDFFEEQLFDPDRSKNDQTWSIQREVDRLINLALSGSGSDMSKGTAYGALNAVTEYFTHGTGRREASRQFWDAYAGAGDSKKQVLYRALMRKVAA
jgi:phage/plasmid-like protein (TIGR03299 family)